MVSPKLSDEDLVVDVVVIGTGLVESITAASLARVGKKVLHLDDRNYFGSNSCSLSFAQLTDWADYKSSAEIAAGQNTADGQSTVVHDDLTFRPRDTGKRLFYDRTFTFLRDDVSTCGLRPNDFAIDICPRLCYGHSDLVDVLCRSGVAKYLEFQIASSSELYHSGQFHAVPLSKTDIFKHPSLELLQKRLLMKFLNKLVPASLAFHSASAAGVDQNVSVDRLESQTERRLDAHIFFSFASQFECSWYSTVRQERLNDHVADMVMYAICMADWRQDECNSVMPQLTTLQGLKRVQHFMMSLGRYGSHAMLYPMYGVADIAQAFTRSCAVHNGIYMLNTRPSRISVQSEIDGNISVAGLSLTSGQQIKCQHVVCNADYVPVYSMLARYRADGPRSIKGIMITNQNVLSSRELALGFIPSVPVLAGSDTPGASNVIHVLQVHAGTGCVPKDHFVIYFCQARMDDDKTDVDGTIQHFVEKIGHSNVLAHGSFVQRSRCHILDAADPQQSPCSRFDDLCRSGWISVVPDPIVTPQLTFSVEVEHARQIFEGIVGSADGFLVADDKEGSGSSVGLLGQMTNDLVAASNPAGDNSF